MAIARAANENRGNYELRSSENEICEKELRTAGLFALDVRPVSNTLVWCSIHPRRNDVFPDRWLFFGFTDRTAGNAR